MSSSKLIGQRVQMGPRTALARTKDEVGPAVYREGSGLVFEPGGDRLAQAQALLEVLRAQAGQLSFGQRVVNGIDAAASLKSYYRSLAVAEALLGEVPGAAGAVQSFLANVSMPDDLRGLLTRALEAPRSGELGSVSFAGDGSYNNLYAAWKQGDPRVTQIDDPTLRKLFAEWRFPGTIGNYFRYGTPEFKVGLTHLAARAVELELPVQVNPAALSAVLPATGEAAAALRRLCRALKIQPDTVALGNRRLSEWPLGQDTLRGTAGAPAAPGFPPRWRAPLGEDQTWSKDQDHRRFWAAWSRGDRRCVQVDDDTLRAFHRWLGAVELSTYVAYGDAQFKAGVVELWARAKELGLGLTVNPAAMPALLQQLPANADAARALRRLASAYDLDARGWRLGGQSLSALPLAPRGAVAVPVAPLLPAPPPPGRVAADRAAIQALLAGRSPELYQLDEAGLRELKALVPQLAQLAPQVLDRGAALGLLELAERSLVGGVRDAADVQRLLGIFPVAHLADETVGLKALWLAHRAGLAPNAVALANRQTLASEPSLRRAHLRKEELLAGPSGPVLPRRLPPAALPAPHGDGPEASYAPTWRARDPRFFDVKDELLVRELVGIADVRTVLAHWRNDTRVFTTFARLAELAPQSSAGANIQAFLAQPVPAAWVSDDSVPRILRMALAARVDPHKVRLETPQGPLPLLAHPLLANGPGAAERAAHLAEDLAELDPRAKRHDAEREGALMRLLLGEGDRHELAELLPALLEARAAGRLAPIDLTGTPEAHQRSFTRALFASWPHSGAQALLAGLLLRAPRDVLVAAFTQHGQLPAHAERAAEQAALLAKLEGPALHFALKRALESPPDLATLELRARMAQPGLDAAGVGALEPLGSPADLATAWLELAGAHPAGSSERRAAATHAERMVAEGALDAATLRKAADPVLLRDLGAEAVARVEELAQALAAAAPEARAAAQSALIAACGSSTFLDASALLERALLCLYAADLERVAPLGQADVDLGGVPGKAWEIRSAGRAEDTVLVEGLRLPRDRREGRAERVPEARPEVVGSPSARRNLRLLAARLLAGGATRVSGGGQREARDLLPHLAALVGTPFTELDARDLSDPATLLSPDGPLARAAEEGELVHLYAPGGLEPELERALNQAIDLEGRLRLAGRPPLVPHPHFHLMISTPTAGQLSRLSGVGLKAPSALDLEAALETGFGAIPGVERKKLAQAHEALATLAAQRKPGESGPEIGPETLALAARRFLTFRARTPAATLSDASLMRREVEEVYTRGLPAGERARAKVELDRILAGAAAHPYDSLPLSLEAGGLRLGDAFIRRDPGAPPLTAADLEQAELSPSLREGVYLLAKAAEMGEVVALSGEALPGLAPPEEVFAFLSGRPFARATLSLPAEADELLAGGALRPELREGILVAYGLEQAPGAVRRALRDTPRSKGEAPGLSLFTRLAEGSGHLEPGITALDLAVSGLPADAAGLIESVAAREGLPRPVAAALWNVGRQVNAGYAAGTLGAALPAAQRPKYELRELLAAVDLTATLAPRLGLAEAYLAAVESVFPAGTDADQASIRKLAEEAGR